MESKDQITINDYERLSGLIEFSSLNTKIPEIVSRLHVKFKAADMLPQDRILATVVTMNSRILLKELSNSRAAEITLTYPHDADGREGKISVLSLIGIALLGRQEHDIVSWRTPSGPGHFEIVKIIYQPEAVGHYYL